MPAKPVSKETTAKKQSPWDDPKPLTFEERISLNVGPLPSAPYFEEHMKALALSEALAWDTLRERATKAKTHKQVEKLIHQTVLAFLRLEGDWPTEKPKNQLLYRLKRLLHGNEQGLKQLRPAFISVLAKGRIRRQSMDDHVYLVADVSKMRKRDNLPQTAVPLTQVEGNALKISSPAEVLRDEQSEAGAPLTDLQSSIMSELEGNALTAPSLAKVLQKPDETVKYALKGLKKLGKVANKRGRGYYRPDAPPQDA